MRPPVLMALRIRVRSWGLSASMQHRTEYSLTSDGSFPPRFLRYIRRLGSHGPRGGAVSTPRTLYQDEVQPSIDMPRRHVERAQGRWLPVFPDAAEKLKLAGRSTLPAFLPLARDGDVELGEFLLKEVLQCQAYSADKKEKDG